MGTILYTSFERRRDPDRGKRPFTQLHDDFDYTSWEPLVDLGMQGSVQSGVRYDSPTVLQRIYVAAKSVKLAGSSSASSPAASGHDSR